MASGRVLHLLSKSANRRHFSSINPLHARTYRVATTRCFATGMPKVDLWDQYQKAKQAIGGMYSIGLTRKVNQLGGLTSKECKQPPRDRNVQTLHSCSLLLVYLCGRSANLGIETSLRLKNNLTRHHILN